MAQLLAIAMLLTLQAPPQKQELPAAFYELPEQVREQATLIVSGTYSEGRTPCIFMADGMRAWSMEALIQIKQVYRGEAGGKFVYLDWFDLLHRGMRMKRDHTYLVLLRPNERSAELIRKGEHVVFWDALDDEEIIAIVELK